MGLIVIMPINFGTKSNVPALLNPPAPTLGTKSIVNFLGGSVVKNVITPAALFAILPLAPTLMLDVPIVTLPLLINGQPNKISTSLILSHPLPLAPPFTSTVDALLPLGAICHLCVGTAAPTTRSRGGMASTK